MLPVLLAGVLLLAAVGRGDLLQVLRAARALGWTAAGGLLAAVAIAFGLSMVFWAGALPLLAADAEMDRRPPSGNFALLAARGFSRVLRAGLVAYGLALAFTAACSAALLAGLPAAAVAPSPLLLAGAALIAAVSVIGGVLIDLLGRLLLVRSAAFGDPVGAGFGKAAALLLERLGSCLVITLAFLFLELITAAVAGSLTGVVAGASLVDPGEQLLALAPRLAVGLAAAAVLGWLEVGRMAALAALVADAEGLIEHPVTPPPLPVAEPVIEALPVDEEP